MERASHVLAAVSRGLGIFISPPLARSVVEHLRFLLLPDGRMLMILIIPGGVTRDKLIRPERSFRQEDLDRIAGVSEPALRRLDAGGDARRSASTSWNATANNTGNWRMMRLLLCDPDRSGRQSRERKVYVEGAAQIASSVEFTDQKQLRELLEAIEEKDRLIALLSGCIESPEPVHVELGLDQMSNAGKHLALVSASYSSKDQVQGTLGILAPMRMHYERVITAVAFMAQFFSEERRGELNFLCAAHNNDKDKEFAKALSRRGWRRRRMPVLNDRLRRKH